MTARSSPPGQRPVVWKTALWLLLSATLCASFILLGNWQLRRLSWKLQLIQDVSLRAHAPAQALPAQAQWPAIRAGHGQYTHLQVHGRFLPNAPTRVHGTSPLGYGYWLMAPFQADNGDIVLINRGYVPADWRPDARTNQRPPQGAVTIHGLLRLSEPGGGFLRPNQPAQQQWYSRDVAAIGQAQGLSAARLAPYFIDQDASAGTSGWPRPGLTPLHFSNPHLGYAVTWYAMALGMLIVAAIPFWRRPGRQTPPAPSGHP